MEKTDDKNDASWVLDSLVGFLKSPVWNLSVLNFIEQKSVIFEPETDDDEQNDALEQEYSTVFNQFKQMVDTLLASHMEDLEISPEQFENACVSAKENLGSRLHSVLFEQLWAAFNYRIFKRMMIQRNIDLQLQALELLGMKLNVSSEALNASSLSPESAICEEEFEMMRKLFKKSLTSNQNTENQNETATKTIDDTVPKTPNDTTKSENSQTKANNESVDVEPEINENQMKMRRISSAKLKDSAFINKIMSSNHENSESNGDNHDKQIEQLDNEQKMLLLMGNKDGKEISKEELEKRQNYLRQQRDKLIELKRKERSKIINKVGDEQQSSGRPKSAKALKASLKKRYNKEDDDDQLEESSATKTTAKTEEGENKENGYRRMLAARLKAELIGDKYGDINGFDPSSTEN